MLALFFLLALASYLEVKADTHGTAIYVGNIPYFTTEDQLTEFLEPAGTVSEVNIIKDNETGRHKGYAIVHFEDDESAAEAVHLFNGADFLGRILRVNFANKKTR